VIPALLPVAQSSSDPGLGPVSSCQSRSGRPRIGEVRVQRAGDRGGWNQAGIRARLVEQAPARAWSRGTRCRRTSSSSPASDRVQRPATLQLPHQRRLPPTRPQRSRLRHRDLRPLHPKPHRPTNQSRAGSTTQATTPEPGGLQPHHTPRRPPTSGSSARHSTRSSSCLSSNTEVMWS
jgi:hypothetical protein